MQFEVVQFRLESEYGAPSRLEAAPWTVVRWLPQDISEEDAEAEGVEEHLGAPQMECDDQVRHYPDASFVKSYRTLWDSLNAKRGFGWQTNPWVWVIAFKRVELKAHGCEVGE